ncbi:hypothetical protein H311_01245, partial [Anncaliia algerae PRA109]
FISHPFSTFNCPKIYNMMFFIIFYSSKLRFADFRDYVGSAYFFYFFIVSTSFIFIFDILLPTCFLESKRPFAIVNIAIYLHNVIIVFKISVSVDFLLYGTVSFSNDFRYLYFSYPISIVLMIIDVSI